MRYKLYVVDYKVRRCASSLPVIGEKQLSLSPADPNRGLLTAVPGQRPTSSVRACWRSQKTEKLPARACMSVSPSESSRSRPVRKKPICICKMSPHLGPVPQRPPVVYAVVADALPQPQQLGCCPGRPVSAFVAALHLASFFVLREEGQSGCTRENWTRRGASSERARWR